MIVLPESHRADVEDSYKYHRQMEITKESLSAKYLQRARQVLRSLLNGKNMVWAINTFAMLIIRYPAGIICWPKEEIKARDMKKRKLLPMH